MKRYYVTVNGTKYEVEIEEVKGEFGTKISTDAEISLGKKEEAVPQTSPTIRPEVKEIPNADIAISGEKIESPMPGTIIKVNISEGASIKKGDVIFTLEAMKMENEIVAPRGGKVIKVAAAKGTVVNTGDILAIIE